MLGLKLNHVSKRGHSYHSGLLHGHLDNHMVAPVPDDFICLLGHYSDVIMGSIASQITSLTIVNSSVYSGADWRKHQSSASLAFVRGIHRRPVNSPHKGPITRKMFPFDDIIMAPSLYLNQYGLIVSNIIMKTFYWNMNRTIYILVCLFENAVCKISAIWFRPDWVDVDTQCHI